MKKILSTVLAGVMATSLVACSSGGNDTSTTGSDTSSDIKVAMVTDYGDITDQSFNQTTYEAAKDWSAANGAEFNYFKPASDSDADREASIEEAIEQGYNVIVMPGFAFAKAIVDVTGDYPDTKFIALDIQQGDLDGAYGEPYTLGDNLYCAIYQEELAGYMAGVAAVKLGYKKLGYLGGMAVPSVIRYGYGFVQGAEAAAAELGLSDVEVKYAYGNQFWGDADITARMDTWYGAGTEVVFACGGGIYTSAAEAAAKVNGKIIGVDVDQAPIVDAGYGEGMTVTSAMKGLYPTVTSALDEIKAGNWSSYGGSIKTLGLVSGTDPSANFVQIPESTQWDDNFTEDDYKQLVSDMYDGKIKVDPTTEESWITDYAGTIAVSYEGNIK
ncbi:MAG: BMP family protein [Bulleidia sp.]